MNTCEGRDGGKNDRDHEEEANGKRKNKARGQ